MFQGHFRLPQEGIILTRSYGSDYPQESWKTRVRYRYDVQLRVLECKTPTRYDTELICAKQTNCKKGRPICTG